MIQRILVRLLPVVVLLIPGIALAAGGGGGGSAFAPTEVGATADKSAPAPASAPTDVGATAGKPAPASAPEKVLKCDQTTLSERVRCRLELSDAELAHEQSIQYLPEECRTLTSGKQETCVARYRNLLPCWAKAVGTQRTACAADKLGLKKGIKGDLSACGKLTGMDKKACQASARDKAFALAKFRFYDLSERAEGLKEKGISVEKISALVSTMEQLKQNFNTAKNYPARRAIILQARAAWKKFVATNKIKGLNNDYLDGALKDLAAAK